MTLLSERQHTLARTIEGVLAELTDQTLDASSRLEGAAREWKMVNSFPRGLSDWGIWREDEKQRVSLNREFDRHRQAVEGVLD